MDVESTLGVGDFSTKSLCLVVAGMGQQSRNQSPLPIQAKVLRIERSLNIYGTTTNLIFMPS